ncbi:hypothetical protein SARC_04089 [Sphaeroforma arctica JP610]|uniref:LNR domain-containing protein n=1 Tax=Sphaeroforma arctica JP610 TaxID=667725 RepID=A0A0L0G4E9_9EUKA|nr:hypothetical protein SARC_04089 [Sphaeroforma arctica JP610]KNC83691.1 hypothetical protein SARC_04089 [Sphaeroforma arctica JP610]|eukprot:XP_014157593.1 hypothetical protein SARC_04089 [Sphaeroforma arctica JP610]
MVNGAMARLSGGYRSPALFGAVIDAVSGFVDTVTDAVDGIPFVETAVSLALRPVTGALETVDRVVNEVENVVGAINYIAGNDETVEDTGSSGGSESCPGCPAAWMGDGFCDDGCFTASCGFDLGDCDGVTASESDCAYGCFDYYIADGICDVACNVAGCSYDGGDCDAPASKYCHLTHVSDTVPGYLTVGNGGDLLMTLEKPTVRWYIDYVNTESFRLSHNGLYMDAG